MLSVQRSKEPVSEEPILISEAGIERTGYLESVSSDDH